MWSSLRFSGSERCRAPGPELKPKTRYRFGSRLGRRGYSRYPELQRLRSGKEYSILPSPGNRVITAKNPIFRQKLPAQPGIKVLQQNPGAVLPPDNLAHGGATSQTVRKGLWEPEVPGDCIPWERGGLWRKEMFNKVFDGNYAGALVGDKVSLKAAFAFASMIFNADQQGIVRGWYLAKGPLNCSHDEWEKIVTELCEAGFIERFNETAPIAKCGAGYILDTIIQYRILNFEQPLRIDRLPQDAWAKLREEVFERDGYVCQYCDTKGSPLECDHIVPLAKGGTNETSNLITACYKCNRSKRDKQITEWRGRRQDHAPA